MEEITLMLTDAIIVADTDEVVELQEQRIAKLEKDKEYFSDRYKKFRTNKEEILMRAVERDTEKVSQKQCRYIQIRE